MAQTALKEQTDRNNLTNRTGRIRKEKQEAWNVSRLLKQTTEEQGKLTQEAWREVEVMLRSHLRRALHKKGADQLTERGIKDLTTAASICHLRAYPDSDVGGLGAHVPARLLKTVSTRLERSRPVPIDVQAIEVVGSHSPDQGVRPDVQDVNKIPASGTPESETT